MEPLPHSARSAADAENGLSDEEFAWRLGALYKPGRVKEIMTQLATYIDLNPVRAGMVADPAEYRFSLYGEAGGGSARGSGKRSREGLVRAMLMSDGVGFSFQVR